MDLRSMNGADARLFVVIACVLALDACAKAGASPEVVSAGRAFLAANAKAPGVHVTASGLEYRVLQSGPASGPLAKETDEVKVNYEGTLLDGTVFDSTYQRGQPTVLGVSSVIPAWTEVLQLMRPGDVWEIAVPADLAYGDQGAGPIPPGSVLKFKIELIAINSGGVAAGDAGGPAGTIGLAGEMSGGGVR